MNSQEKWYIIDYVKWISTGEKYTDRKFVMQWSSKLLYVYPNPAEEII